MTTREEIDAFKAHPLWTHIKDVKANLTGSTPRSSTDRETIARVLSTLDYLGEFHHMPASLFPSSRTAVADALNQHITSLESQWQGWDASAAMTASTVQQIDSICDQIMGYLRDNAWPPLQKESRAAAIKNAAEAYRVTAEAALEGLSTTVAAHDARLLEAQATLTQLVLDAEARQSDASAALETIKATRDAQAENAAEQLQAELGKMNGAAKSQRAEIQQQLGIALDGWTSEAETAIVELRRDAATGEKLVQIVGDQANAGGYLKFAEKEKRSYRLWIAAGIIAVAVAALYLYVQFQEYAHDKDPSFALVVFKAALSLTVLAFSGFCFREAGKRQRQSLEARYRALDLLALRPYTNDLDDVDKRVFRELLGQRLFGHSPEEPHRKTDEKVTTLRVDVGDAKTILDTIKVAKDVTGA